MSDDWFQTDARHPRRSSRSGSSAPPPRTCASPPRRSARRARRSSARSSTSPRSRARWATPARRTTRRARPRVVGLTKTLAKEWGQFKINVNAVAFGYIETRLTASKDDANRWRSAARRSSSASPTSCAGWPSMLIPLGRPGTPEEAAGGVFFLCSPWSNYVHGQVAQRHRRPVHRDDDLSAAHVDRASSARRTSPTCSRSCAPTATSTRSTRPTTRCWRCRRALIADPEREGLQLIARDAAGARGRLRHGLLDVVDARAPRASALMNDLFVAPRGARQRASPRR